MIRPVHTIRVEPEGIELQVKEGQTIFRAADEAGIEWPTRCGGAQQCAVRAMTVFEGANNLSQADSDELFRTAALARLMELDPARLRMACNARMRGLVTVLPRHRLPARLEV